MNIQDFCSDSNDSDLDKHLATSIDTYEGFIKMFSDPNFIGSLLDILDDYNETGKVNIPKEMPEETIIMPIMFLANSLNMEVIKKEKFRREMES